MQIIKRKVKSELQKMNKIADIKISTDEESEDEMNCTCEILNDTSLQDVGDSDCSCSECLEANLNAFNQLKEVQEEQKIIQARSLGKITTKNRKNYQQSLIKQDGINTQERFARNSNLSINKKTILQNSPFQQRQGSVIDDRTRQNRFTRQNINDYILITKQRTRQYLNQRNKVNHQNKKVKDQLKQKIKENLQILKYTVSSIQQKEQLLNEKQNQPLSKPPIHKWNHAPAVSKQIQQIRETRATCKNKLKKRKDLRKKVITNLEKLIPEFSSNPSQFLESAKQKRLQKFKSCQGCPYDHCPNHHMRTSKQRLLEIQKFIKDKVKKYNVKKKKEKLKQEEKQKIKKAKLRAIQIRSKEALKRSKKYDPSESRTSFHLTMDHFSTFSELRANKKQKDEEMQHKNEVKKAMKQKGGKLQEAIYEEVFENQSPIKSDQQPITKIQLSKKIKKQYCEKITKQAKINSPKRLKPEDEEHKKDKKQKRKNPMNSNQQKKKSKQLVLQIERKKMELMEQYRKQKQLKESKNQRLKNQLHETLLSSKD